MAEEKKAASKQRKKPAAAKKNASKPTATEKVDVKPVQEKKETANSTTITEGSTVTTPSGKVCKVLSIEEDICHLQRVDNQKSMFLNKNKLSLKK